jgi:O-glycosyl hydrolase
MSYASIPDSGRPRLGDLDKKGWSRFLTAKYVVPAVLSASLAYVVSTSLVWHPTLVVSNTARNFALYETCKNNGVAMRKMTQVDFPDGLSGLRRSSVGEAGGRGSSSSSGSAGSHAVVGYGATITVKSNVHHQRMEGFGGAFTEAAALNFASLPEKEQQRVIDTYFGDQGIGLTMGRIHINSCDFSPMSYTFDDVADDYELKHFDMGVAHDQETMIPFVKRAKAAIERRGETFKLVASPWSPPAWMKAPVPSTGEPSMTDSASPNGLLPGDRVRQSWASYITKWVQAYANSGVDVWAVTPQNEPEFNAPWEACKWNASGELDFINRFLGPILKSSFPQINILAFDHNKDSLLDWTKTIIGGDEGNFVDGMAFHCMCLTPHTTPHTATRHTPR